jgi:hypothetical protein
VNCSACALGVTARGRAPPGEGFVPRRVTFVSRTEIVTRVCPECGTKIRIPVAYESGPGELSDDDRPWRMGRGYGCPGGCELTNKQLEQLV